MHYKSCMEVTLQHCTSLLHAEDFVHVNPTLALQLFVGVCFSFFCFLSCLKSNNLDSLNFDPANKRRRQSDTAEEET